MIIFKVVIPARYASERLPGKPLRDIAGKPMLQHVYERGLESDAGQVVIATDDERIEKVAEAFGAIVCMTGAHHQSGTDRIAEVAEKLGWADDQVIVNLQGDEPMMPAELINQCAALLDDPNVDVATLASPLEEAADLRNPNIVKVVTDDEGNALYFSRASIPHSRTPDTDDLAVRTARHHHGIYAYRSAILRQIVAAPPTALENCERLEQLRALSLGLRIKVGSPARRPGPGIDTEQDLEEVTRTMKKKNRSNRFTSRTNTLIIISILTVFSGVGQLQGQGLDNRVIRLAEQVGQAKIEYKIKMEPKTPDRKSCRVHVSLAYLQYNDQAQVDATIENEDCAASSGEYTVRLKIRNQDSDIQLIENVESWARNDDKPIETQTVYDIGHDVDLIRVSTAKLTCTCSKPDEDADDRTVDESQ